METIKNQIIYEKTWKVAYEVGVNVFLTPLRTHQVVISIYEIPDNFVMIVAFSGKDNCSAVIKVFILSFSDGQKSVMSAVDGLKWVPSRTANAGMHSLIDSVKNGSEN